uniref:Uncharacterized protein n=1 Tax=Plectus sambesii TaxID=2011161 RepID=A0A914XQJ6_9BILA
MSDGASNRPKKKATDATVIDEASTSTSTNQPRKARISTAFRARRNCGRWSSEELKKLYDSIKKRGCKREDVPLIAIDVLTRSTDQVVAKLEE